MGVKLVVQCFQIVLYMLVALSWEESFVSSMAPTPEGTLLRLRLPNGAMERIVVPKGAEGIMTLDGLLQDIVAEDVAEIQVDGTTITNPDHPLSSLGLQRGSLITLKAPATDKPTESRLSNLKGSPQPQKWHPFPELAKDFKHALWQTKTKRVTRQGMSYGDIARLQSSMHLVEPQAEGPLKRVYMCQHSAQRFHASGLRKKGDVLSRAGLLLGTIQRERVEKKPRKARTSLSSDTSDSEFCTVAKVHSVWEPPGQQGHQVYDASLASNLLGSNARALAVADNLGLVPVGWIFTHSDDRHHDDESLPVYATDVEVGANLQAANMRKTGEAEGRQFVTLSMDANTGATEAFQLSDVAVQIVHEGLFVKRGPGRMVKTKNSVLVDGQETTEFDSVLCLINTAMLSHEGAFSGKTTASFVKRNGGLNNKGKRTIRKLLQDDHQLLETLCDFNTMLALDQLLSREDSETLCHLVKKWSRGQKQGTKVDSALKSRLRGILET